MSGKRKIRIISAALAVGIALAAVFAAVYSSCKPSLSFKATFYYLYLDRKEDALSACALTAGARDLGGAGYVINDGGGYLVVLACYYSEEEAEEARSRLKEGGTECSILKACREEYATPTASSRRNARRYEGNLNTMLSLSKMCYDLANSLDCLELGQAAAKAVLGDIRLAAEGLYKANAGNCFAEVLRAAYEACEDCGRGFLRSCDVRALQLAFADGVISVNIY